MRESINYFAVIVSAVVSLGISFVWFMLLFREPYIVGLGRTRAQMDAGPNTVEASAMQLVGNIALAFALAWLMQKLDYQTVLGGIKLGTIIWLAFVAAVIGPMYAYQAFSFQFFLINTGSVLLTLLVTGAILGAWK